ncbi:MAG: anti-sigma regulatory factor [Spirochaetes bacterium GWD1_61_31]|nr:MAG: anti-sigma regulatory factor [Spirochaetes bacterium GWB1_60_80]OHD31892.1 MAG: anti-sigma regulatory factor [Spirochaetes bacterium GWC1_61_12]OHD40011.1 MAG: anti-sigma regulatory factor [Spirochaetes bacterium GWD1_61_31]OHD42335.1 MAG: anti-sigma regulatory factor [Spirochaetes bacterium GWE1_60_18]HAW86945.1 anti-sigma regulatory factor [Spirochaetaceae bacterium]
MKLHFDVPGDDLSLAGKASSELKKALGRLGIDPVTIKRTAVAMYEAEINMVIHAHGGSADAEIGPAGIDIRLQDSGPGIPDLDMAMQEGYSTAPEAARELGFGAGMGLPNMKRNADDLRIESTVGVGTTVTIRITLPGSTTKAP